MKSLRRLLPAVLVLALPAVAAAQGGGSNTVSLQIGNGTGDFVQAQYAVGKVAYATSWPVGILEPRVELAHEFAPGWSVNASAALGWFAETDSPGPIASPPGNVDHVTTLSAVMARVGVDKVVPLGHQASLYFGPGLEWWSGHSKYETYNPTETSSTVTRWSVSTRIGATMWLGDQWGLTCNVGRRVGYASTDWEGAKASWWPSSTSASGGVMFGVGGREPVQP